MRVEPIYRWKDQSSAPRAGLVQGSDGCFYGTTSIGGVNGNGTIFRINAAGEHTVLHLFRGIRDGVPDEEIDGQRPNAKLVLGSDGYFYGTTSYGGTRDCGTVFRINVAGKYTVLHSFSVTEGAHPDAELVQGSDGYFYGTTSSGGPYNGKYGTIFRIGAAGEFKVLYSFTGIGGGIPAAGCVQGSDGYIYGTTVSGGSSRQGVIFRISTAGEYSVVHSFTGAEGSMPRTTLVQGNDGYFYGTNSSGGANGAGTVFKCDSAGRCAVIHAFTGLGGSNPGAGLVFGSDGYFYGATPYGGTSGNGTIFRVNASGEFTVLHSFERPYAKTHYCSGLVQGNDGYIYGTTSGEISVNGTVFRISVAGEYVELHSFTRADGQNPYAELLQGGDSHFYGTTCYGGTRNTGPASSGTNGNGTIFCVNEAGEYAVLHSFSGIDGSNPKSGLVQGTDGYLYGTTFAGGSNGYGTVFRISTAGEYTVLHSFCGTDGAHPVAELVQGRDSYFYGTTSSSGENGFGTVFRISAEGEYTVLHSFAGPDGSAPTAKLVQGSDGQFYGATANGGANERGTIFRIGVAGEYMALHHFSGPDGSAPEAGLVQDNGGNLYGTTSYGGSFDKGAVFRMSTAGEYVLLHSFSGSDGSYPYAGLVQGIDGKLYGATSYGGSRNCGAVFRISTAGECAVLHSFTGSDGMNPQAAPVVGRDGNLWGTTSSDNSYAGGTIYRLIVEPVTLPADRVTYLSAIIRTTVSCDVGTTVQFEYSTDPNFAEPEHTDVVSLPEDTNAIAVTVELANLVPNTTYYYRAGVRRADGFVQFGEILSFTTGLAEPQAAVVVSKGAAVPGAGTPGSGIPSGAIWRTFGVPAWGGNSRLAFVANMQLPTGGPLTGIVAGAPAAPVVVAKRGDTAPGLLLGTVFSSFKDPVINQAGEVAFISRVTGGLLPGKSRQGIWSNVGVSSGKPEWLVALQGIQAADAPFGAIWKTFKSVVISDSGVITFTATLEQGRGGVTAANDFGLWQATPSGTSLLLREGQTLEMDGVTRKVKSFVALSLTNSMVPVQVIFSDNTQALLGFSADAEPEVIAASGDVVSNGGFAIFRSFGMPAFSGTGETALNAKLVRGTSGTISDRGVFVSRDGSWSIIARKGSVAPGVSAKGSPTKFTSFSDPLINAEGQVAFLGTTTGSIQGIWWSGGLESDLQLVASTADTTVPGLYGARFTAFRSLALPDGELAGPVFVAKVEGMGIDSSNDVGLWAVDSAGVLRLIVREGDVIEGKVLRSFTVLSTVQGSSAQPGSYNANRQLLYRAFFTDGSQSLITVRIP